MEKKSCLKSQDIISNLPDDIVDKILARFSMKDVVKMSVLSSKWRYKWASIPRLVFRGAEFQNNTDKLVAFVNRVLLIHKGPIKTFMLGMKTLENSSAIDSWIHFLSRSNVEDLALEFLQHDTQRYKIPSIVFSFQKLTYLSLLNCILEPQISFTGFRNLKTLFIDDIIVTNVEIFENMISKSNFPVLENLSVISNNNFTRLKINAPNLQWFYFRGYFDDICFVDTPHITCVYIQLLDINTDKQFERVSSDLINVLGCLTCIKTFYMVGYFLQFLATFNLPRCFQLPVSFHHLNMLSLKVNFEDLNENSVTVCLLKSSPNLQELKIYAESNGYIAQNLVERFWKEHDQLVCSMNHLKMININHIMGTYSETEFIKFVLANSPLLEVLNLSPGDADINEAVMLKELLRFQRASPNAKIEYDNR